MISVCFFVGFISSAFSENQNNPSFLQFSDNGSGIDNGGLDDSKRVLIIFGLNLLICLFCCGFLQCILNISKSYNNKLLIMKKNYKTIEELKRLKKLNVSKFSEKNPEPEKSLPGN